jgi:hypothetical protein
MSDDQREVFTEYPLFGTITLRDSRAGRRVPITGVTVLGGTVEIAGLRYTSEHLTLPVSSLTPGSEYLLLLRESGGRFYIAGKYYGIFAVAPEGVAPLARRRDFANDFKSLTVPEAVDRMSRFSLRTPR